MPSPHPLGPVPGDNQVLRMPVFWAKATYDFAVDGGVQGDINLFPDAAIPNGSLILAAFMNVVTVPTSAGAAQVALKSEAAADLQTQVVISGAPWSTTGWKAATKTFATSPVKPTANRNVAATIAVADLTAGKFEVLVAYLPPGL